MDALIPLNYAVLTEHWDADNEKVTAEAKHFNRKAVQNEIEGKKSNLIQFIEKLERSGQLEGLSPLDIKNRFLGKEDRLFCQSYMEQMIKRFELSGNLGNAKVYSNTLSFVNRINKFNPLYFEDITYKWLIDAETDHLSRGKGYTTLSIYLRTIRAVINSAIKEKITTREHYPFAIYSIKSGKPKKRAISKEFMDQIEASTFANIKLEETRKIFLLLFFLRGMNFWDLALLKLENISNNRIIYTRAKTHKQYSVNINEKANTILKPYLEGKDENDFIFDYVTRTEPALIRKDIENARHTFNKYLTKIGEELKISTPLTSYVSRHSYATIGKKMGVSMAALSESLGHSELKTTQIYLDSFENEYLDDVNKLITG
jgi:site-specific recombinase XerD